MVLVNCFRMFSIYQMKYYLMSLFVALLLNFLSSARFFFVSHRSRWDSSQCRLKKSQLQSTERQKTEMCLKTIHLKRIMNLLGKQAQNGIDSKEIIRCWHQLKHLEYLWSKRLSIHFIIKNFSPFVLLLFVFAIIAWPGKVTQSNLTKKKFNNGEMKNNRKTLEQSQWIRKRLSVHSRMNEWIW